MYKIVFSDIDGTLLNSRHVVTPMTREAILGLEKRGIRFVIVSARSPSGIFPIMRKNGFRCPVISYSGAYILDEDGTVVYQKGMAQPKAKEIISFLETKKFSLTWNIFSGDDWIVKDRKDPRIVREEGIVEACAREGSIDSVLPQEKVHKILLICEEDQVPEIEMQLKENFPEVNTVRSSPILLEIMDLGVNKAEAVKILCEHWKSDVRETIAFGDNYNDMEMLQAVGCGVAMGNAPKDIQEKFEYVTKDNDHDVIAYMLEMLLKQG